MTRQIAMASLVFASALVAVESVGGKVCEKGWTRFSWSKCGQLIPCKDGDKCAPKYTKAACSTKSANAARIQNADENYAIQMLARKNKGRNYYLFIDGSDKKEESKWVDETGMPLNYAAWAHREPNNKNGEDCIGLRSGGMSDRGMWNDISCIQQHKESAHVCQKQPVLMGGWSRWGAWTGCPVTCGGGGRRTRNRTCDQPKPSLYCVGASMETESCNIQPCPVPSVLCGTNWTQASPKKCVKLVRCKHKCDSNKNVEVCAEQGGVVARVDSDEENKVILALRPAGVNYLYIDGNDRDTEGTWVDMHNAELKYTNWAPGEPNNSNENEHCLAMRNNDNGDWNDLQCEARGRAVHVCQKIPDGGDRKG